MRHEWNLDFDELTEANVQELSQLEESGQLDCLYLRLHSVTSTLNLLCNLKSLYSLHLSGATIIKEDLSAIQGIHGLAKLDPSYSCGIKDLSPISNIQTLEVVKLSGCEQLKGVDALGKLLKLKELDVSATPITDSDLSQLSQSNTLVKIDLHSCTKLTDVNALSSIGTLEIINLSDCTALTHIGKLFKLPALKELYLSRTPITDEEVKSLITLRQQLGLPPIKNLRSDG